MHYDGDPIQKQDKIMAWTIVVGFFLIIATVFTGGFVIGRRLLRKEAVEAGVAEWVIIDDSGKSGFRWKSPGTASTTIPLPFEDFEAAE